jgi:AraC family transcriptional regulator, arabinose operon regulatory protein
MRNRCEREVAKLLRDAGVRFSSLSDVPLRTIRHTQRGAFPDMRMGLLPPAVRDDALRKPVLKDLLCTRVGFQGPSPAHYIPRPNGSYDCILIVCTKGRGWLQIGGREWTIQKYDAFLLPQHVPHTYGADPEAPWANYWVHFQGRQSGAYSALLAPDSAAPVFHLYRTGEVIACLEQLYRSMSEVYTDSSLIAGSGALSQLLGLIQLRMHSAERKAWSVEDGIEKGVEFMHKNLGFKLSLQRLAEVAGLSPNHYGAVFKKCHGHSPIDHFNRLKIQKACELLKTTNLRVREIGEMLGLPDPYYFSRLFKKIMGISPRQYR